MIEEARHVADALGLPYWWLNEQASIYISGKDDPGKRRVNPCLSGPSQSCENSSGEHPSQRGPYRTTTVPYSWP